MSLPKWFKTVCTAMSLVYFLTNCVFARSVETNFWAERKRAAAVSGTSSHALEPQLAQAPSAFDSSQILNNLRVTQTAPLSSALSARLQETLPKNFDRTHGALLNALPFANGQVRQISIPSAGSGLIVVHIQDVHMNAEAQENIARTVQSLIDQRQADVVALEGASEPISLRRFRNFPHRDGIQAAADYLLKKNEITGPIYSTLTSSVEIPPVIGIDDPKHYAANVEAYRQSAAKQKEYREKILDWKNDLAARKSKTFNPELLNFDSKVEAYRAKQISLGEYVKTIADGAMERTGERDEDKDFILRSEGDEGSRMRDSSAKSRPQNDSSPTLSPSLHPSISPSVLNFLHALHLEETLDFKQVETQRDQIISQLVRAMKAADLSALVNRSLAYRLGQMKYSDFYRYLETICRSSGVDLKNYPATSAYIEYVSLSDKIDSQELFVDMGRMEKAAYSRLAATAEERQLVDESKQLYYVSRLVDFSLTPEEWKEYKTPGATGLDFSSFENFYREADIRSEAIVDNLMKAVPSLTGRKSQVAILVTGGFHSDQIEARLKARGATVITFAPRVSKVDSDNGSAYLSVFAQEKTPLEKLFEGKKLFLATNPFPADEAGKLGFLAAINTRFPEDSVKMLSDRPRDILGVAAKLSKKFSDIAVRYVSGRTLRMKVQMEAGQFKSDEEFLHEGVMAATIFGWLVFIAGSAWTYLNPGGVMYGVMSFAFAGYTLMVAGTAFLFGMIFIWARSPAAASRLWKRAHEFPQTIRRAGFWTWAEMGLLSFVGVSEGAILASWHSLLGIVAEISTALRLGGEISTASQTILNSAYRFAFLQWDVVIFVLAFLDLFVVFVNPRHKGWGRKLINHYSRNGRLGYLELAGKSLTALAVMALFFPLVEFSHQSLHMVTAQALGVHAQVLLADGAWGGFWHALLPSVYQILRQASNAVNAGVPPVSWGGMTDYWATSFPKLVIIRAMPNIAMALGSLLLLRKGYQRRSVFTFILGLGLLSWPVVFSDLGDYVLSKQFDVPTGLTPVWLTTLWRQMVFMLAVVWGAAISLFLLLKNPKHSVDVLRNGLQKLKMLWKAVSQRTALAMVIVGIIFTYLSLFGPHVPALANGFSLKNFLFDTLTSLPLISGIVLNFVGCTDKQLQKDIQKKVNAAFEAVASMRPVGNTNQEKLIRNFQDDLFSQLGQKPLNVSVSIAQFIHADVAQVSFYGTLINGPMLAITFKSKEMAGAATVDFLIGAITYAVANPEKVLFWDKLTGKPTVGDDRREPADCSVLQQQIVEERNRPVGTLRQDILALNESVSALLPRWHRDDALGADLARLYARYQKIPSVSEEMSPFTLRMIKRDLSDLEEVLQNYHAHHEGNLRIKRRNAQMAPQQNRLKALRQIILSIDGLIAQLQLSENPMNADTLNYLADIRQETDEVSATLESFPFILSDGAATGKLRELRKTLDSLQRDATNMHDIIAGIKSRQRAHDYRAILRVSENASPREVEVAFRSGIYLVGYAKWALGLSRREVTKKLRALWNAYVALRPNRGDSSASDLLPSAAVGMTSALGAAIVVGHSAGILGAAVASLGMIAAVAMAVGINELGHAAEIIGRGERPQWETSDGRGLWKYFVPGEFGPRLSIQGAHGWAGLVANGFVILLSTAGLAVANSGPPALHGLFVVLLASNLAVLAASWTDLKSSLNNLPGEFSRRAVAMAIAGIALLYFNSFGLHMPSWENILQDADLSLGDILSLLVPAIIVHLIGNYDSDLQVKIQRRAHEAFRAVTELRPSGNDEQDERIRRLQDDLLSHFRQQTLTINVGIAAGVQAQVAQAIFYGTSSQGPCLNLTFKTEKLADAVTEDFLIGVMIHCLLNNRKVLVWDDMINPPYEPDYVTGLNLVPPGDDQLDYLVFQQYVIAKRNEVNRGLAQEINALGAEVQNKFDGLEHWDSHVDGLRAWFMNISRPSPEMGRSALEGIKNNLEDLRSELAKYPDTRAKRRREDLSEVEIRNLEHLKASILLIDKLLSVLEKNNLPFNYEVYDSLQMLKDDALETAKDFSSVPSVAKDEAASRLIHRLGDEIHALQITADSLYRGLYGRLLQQLPRGDYYAVLGVPRKATAEQIETAFRGRRQLMRLTRKPGHLNFDYSLGAFKRRLREIKTARETLLDAEKRKQYDLRFEFPAPPGNSASDLVPLAVVLIFGFFAWAASTVNHSSLGHAVSFCIAAIVVAFAVFHYILGHYLLHNLWAERSGHQRVRLTINVDQHGVLAFGEPWRFPGFEIRMPWGVKRQWKVRGFEIWKPWAIRSHLEGSSGWSGLVGSALGVAVSGIMWMVFGHFHFGPPFLNFFSSALVFTNGAMLLTSLTDWRDSLSPVMETVCVKVSGLFGPYNLEESDISWRDDYAREESEGSQGSEDMNGNHSGRATIPAMVKLFTVAAKVFHADAEFWGRKYIDNADRWETEGFFVLTLGLCLIMSFRMPWLYSLMAAPLIFAALAGIFAGLHAVKPEWLADYRLPIHWAGVWGVALRYFVAALSLSMALSLGRATWEAAQSAASRGLLLLAMTAGIAALSITSVVHWVLAEKYHWEANRGVISKTLELRCGSLVQTGEEIYVGFEEGRDDKLDGIRTINVKPRSFFALKLNPEFSAKLWARWQEEQANAREWLAMSKAERAAKLKGLNLHTPEYRGPPRVLLVPLEETQTWHREQPISFNALPGLKVGDTSEDDLQIVPHAYGVNMHLAGKPAFPDEELKRAALDDNAMVRVSGSTIVGVQVIGPDGKIYVAFQFHRDSAGKYNYKPFGGHQEMYSPFFADKKWRLRLPDGSPPDALSRPVLDLAFYIPKRSVKRFWRMFNRELAMAERGKPSGYFESRSENARREVMEEMGGEHESGEAVGDGFAFFKREDFDVISPSHADGGRATIPAMVKAFETAGRAASLFNKRIYPRMWGFKYINNAASIETAFLLTATLVSGALIIVAMMRWIPFYMPVLGLILLGALVIFFVRSHRWGQRWLTSYGLHVNYEKVKALAEYYAAAMVTSLISLTIFGAILAAGQNYPNDSNSKFFVFWMFVLLCIGILASHHSWEEAARFHQEINGRSAEQDVDSILPTIFFADPTVNPIRHLIQKALVALANWRHPVQEESHAIPETKTETANRGPELADQTVKVIQLMRAAIKNPKNKFVQNILAEEILKLQGPMGPIGVRSGGSKSLVGTTPLTAQERSVFQSLLRLNLSRAGISNDGLILKALQNLAIEKTAIHFLADEAERASLEAALRSHAPADAADIRQSVHRIVLIPSTWWDIDDLDGSKRRISRVIKAAITEQFVQKDQMSQPKTVRIWIAGNHAAPEFARFQSYVQKAAPAKLNGIDIEISQDDSFQMRGGVPVLDLKMLQNELSGEKRSLFQVVLASGIQLDRSGFADDQALEGFLRQIALIALNELMRAMPVTPENFGDWLKGAAQLMLSA